MNYVSMKTISFGTGLSGSGGSDGIESLMIRKLPLIRAGLF